LEQIKKAVFARQKTLAEIYEKHGRLTLAEYVKSWKTRPMSPDNLVVRHLEVSLRRIYGKELAAAVAVQFSENGLVSTIDHHGIFGHPFFLNSNLIFSLKAGVEFLPVLSTSGVSLNNSSWPGCLALTDQGDNRLARLSFFSDDQKTRTVFKSDRITPARQSDALGKAAGLGFLSAEQKKQLSKLLDNVFRQADFANFSDQACFFSHEIWKAVFPSAPRLVYFPLEDLVSGILAEAVCADPEHILHKLFFTPEGWGLAEKYFNGARGAFGGGKGSFLFWGLDSKARRFAFVRQGKSLVGGNKSLGLEPERIAAALQAREIYPTSLVCFLVLLHYGATCIGGFNQTTWLTEIKNKFAALLAETGEAEASSAVASQEAGNFAEGSLAILRNNSGYFKASALDLYLRRLNYFGLVELAGKMTLAQSIEAELPEVYRIGVPAAEKEAGLMALGLGEIVKLNGLEEILSGFSD